MNLFSDEIGLSNERFVFNGNTGQQSYAVGQLEDMSEEICCAEFKSIIKIVS